MSLNGIISMIVMMSMVWGVMGWICWKMSKSDYNGNDETMDEAQTADVSGGK